MFARRISLIPSTEERLQPKKELESGVSVRRRFLNYHWGTERSVALSFRFNKRSYTANGNDQQLLLLTIDQRADCR